MAAATVVCWSITSLNQTRYGSGVAPGAARQGSARRWRSYQARRVAGTMADEAQGIDTAPHVALAKRHVYGPRPIGALLPSLTRPAFRRQGPAAAQVLADWPLIIGPELAALTQPRRLVGGTLTIACSGPMAMELQHLAPEL